MEFETSGDAECPGLADLFGPTLDHYILVNAARGRGRESATTKDGLLGLIEQVPHEDGLELLGHFTGLVRGNGTGQPRTRGDKAGQRRRKRTGSNGVHSSAQDEFSLKCSGLLHGPEDGHHVPRSDADGVEAGRHFFHGRQVG